MKAVALATFFALLLGLAAGITLERDRRLRAAAESPQPAAAANACAAPAPQSGERVAALEAEIARLSSRLAAVEARPASAAPGSFGGPPGPRPVANAGPQVEALRAEMAALIAKHDGEGLTFLAKRLAALGEAGYPSIMEIAKLLLADEEKDPNEFGDYDIDGTLFGNDAEPIMEWALANPGLSPPAYRLRAIDALGNRTDMDVAHLFLASIRGETDPEVMAKLCEGVSWKMRAGILDDVEAAVRAVGKNEKAIDHLFQGLRELGEESSCDSLDRLSGPDVPAEVSDRAKSNRMLWWPPETGYLMLSVETGSAWHGAGLRTGDIILEADGRAPESEVVKGTMTDSDGKVTETTSVTDWMSSIGEDDTLVLRVMRDGETRTITIHGNDGKSRGEHVDKRNE